LHEALQSLDPPKVKSPISAGKPLLGGPSRQASLQEIVAAQERGLPVRANETSIFDDSRIPTIDEWTAVEARDTREPSQLVVASPTPVRSCALGANPDDHSMLLPTNGSFVQSIIVSRPPALPSNVSLKSGQALEPLDDPDRCLLRGRSLRERG
jgi:hypothetical protein